MWLYNSAWGDWGELDRNNASSTFCNCLLDSQDMNNKVLSIMMHHSQDPPLIHYNDSRPFYEKILERNSSKLNPGLYEEVFQITTKDEFKLMKRENI